MSTEAALRLRVRPEVGDAAPPLTGVRSDNSFFSLDAQAGRPAALLIAGQSPPERLVAWFEALGARSAAFAELACDLRLVLDLQSRHASAFAKHPDTAPMAVFCTPQSLGGWGGDAPYLAVIDRAARVVALCEGEAGRVADAALAALAHLPREAPHEDCAPAPILVIPDIVPQSYCRALIAHFEASPHERGGMAGRDAEGRGYHKIDEAKKRRHDFVLGPKDPMLSGALDGIIRRCVPEIRKAFNVTIAHTDRLLVARYGQGGFFLRHRDNAAPGVDFRQFALSVNLNDDYEGGHVTFPEYNSRLYRPRAGSGVVFSCSLLHEATPVSKGARYVLLTFLHDAAAQARWLASQKAQAA